jgi:hypothetical protein
MHLLTVSARRTLPVDGAGALAGRVWRPDANGPSVVTIRREHVIDISRAFPTMRDLCEAPDPARAAREAEGDPLGALDPILANTPPDTRDPTKPWLLAPIDLQAVKAAGVTFAVSTLERVIEERARVPGDRPEDAQHDNFAPLVSLAWQAHVYGDRDARLAEMCAKKGVALHVFAWGPKAQDAGLQRNALYLVRPDGYIGLADQTRDAATLDRYLDHRGLVPGQEKVL